MKLIMCKGLPGSGKSTWAREYIKNNPNTKRINKDDLRRMLDDSVWSRKNEDFILLARDTLIQEGLDKGLNIIVDDTNLAPKHEARLKQLAISFGAEFEIKDFTDVPIETCIANDLKRLDSVGEAVIRKMYKDFLAPKIVQKEFDSSLTWAILCDIDGTLALFGNANPYDRDFSKDIVNEPVASILASYSEIPRILLSGRNGKYEEVTRAWLDTNGINYSRLFMRKEGDTRKDAIIKEEIYWAEIEGKYNVLFVLDDRNQVVGLWRSLGLTCLQVAEGNF